MRHKRTLRKGYIKAERFNDLIRDVGFKPETPIEEGGKKFVEWYREYYKK